MPSQYNEDRIITEFFGSRTGRFLDLGAYDGKTFSNVDSLIAKGWRGVMVEASPKCFVQLQANVGSNKNVTLVCCAMDTSAALTKFYDSAGAVASLDEGHKRKWASAQGDFMDIYIHTITPKGLLSKLPGPYHFLSIDLEGVSAHVLRLFPELTVCGVDLLCIELSEEERLKVTPWIENNGYKFHACTEENTFYRRVT